MIVFFSISDIDECFAGLHRCWKYGPDYECYNTAGDYLCCVDGVTDNGDGVVCAVTQYGVLFPLNIHVVRVE